MAVEEVREILTLHETKTTLRFGSDLEFDPNTGVAKSKTAKARLTPKEGELLTAFMLKNGRVLTKEAAVDALYWRSDEPKNPKNMDKLIYLLRGKIEPLGYYLLTEPMRGWRLNEGVPEGEPARAVSNPGKFTPKPQRPVVRGISLSVSNETYQKLVTAARQGGISLKELVRQLVDFGLESM